MRVRNVIMFRILGLKYFKAQWLLHIAYRPFKQERIPRFFHKMYLFHMKAGINSDYNSNKSTNKMQQFHKFIT